MKKVDILLGLQWGDEGKGKIVDVLTPEYDIIARFQGGPNAGHTLEFDGRKHVLHTIPSGVFHENKQNVIGNGVVIDPVVFCKEIDELVLAGAPVYKNLLISRRAHLILPSHKLLDAAYEKAKGKEKIGSTLKGIGPTYTDKVARIGLRIGDIELPDFKQKYEALKNHHQMILDSLNSECTDDKAEQAWFEAVEKMRAFAFIDSEQFFYKALNNGKRVLAEGAQGALLDIDFGSYPFVTSSNTVAAGACTGLGIPPSAIGNVYGIFKAYCTRVGSGPFPTELEDETGELLRKNGNEFGSTTGRPRRCGWLDLPALKYSVWLNGVTNLILMKADVLNDFQTLKVCIGYNQKGNIVSHLPFQLDESITPVYTEMNGWSDALSSDGINLSTEVADYINFIEKETGIPIDYLSVGPDRTQTINLK